MASIDSWWTWNDGVDGQLVDLERWRGWTVVDVEMAWMKSWWMWRDGVDRQLVDME